MNGSFWIVCRLHASGAGKYQVEGAVGGFSLVDCKAEPVVPDFGIMRAF
jgi:hypothetical protein